MVLKPRQPCSGKRYIYGLCEVCLELNEYKTGVILFYFIFCLNHHLYLYLIIEKFIYSVKIDKWLNHVKLYIFYRIYFLNFYIFDLHACSYKIFIPCIVRLKLIYPDIKEQICANGIESKSITLEFSHQNLTSVLIISFYPPLLVI
jgi:hypothetical protein